MKVLEKLNALLRCEQRNTEAAAYHLKQFVSRSFPTVTAYSTRTYANLSLHA